MQPPRESLHAPPGNKSKKRKTEPEFVGSIQTTSFPTEKTDYIEMLEFKPQHYREFNSNNNTDKSEITDGMDEETIVPFSEEQSVAVNDARARLF